MRVSRVDAETWSFAAAPDGPETRPLVGAQRYLDHLQLAVRLSLPLTTGETFIGGGGGEMDLLESHDSSTQKTSI